MFSPKQIFLYNFVASVGRFQNSFSFASVRSRSSNARSSDLYLKSTEEKNHSTDFLRAVCFSTATHRPLPLMGAAPVPPWFTGQSGQNAFLLRRTISSGATISDQLFSAISVTDVCGQPSAHRLKSSAKKQYRINTTITRF